uniref:Synaptopodin 2 n=1 Tax=Neogobius melanostomus TaxID=47308 RepID=A0A8C6V247_9GOBI
MCMCPCHLKPSHCCLNRSKKDSPMLTPAAAPNFSHIYYLLCVSAGLRRSESLSEKQVKEAKSKCKRIALLLKAAPPNPNNKGVLMFKKHRQRAKKYTLVSYGTGEEDPEYRSDEEEDDEDTHTVELTIVPSKDIELTNANSSTGVINISFDKGLLETERNLKNKLKMECETSGKGAVMFAQRRLRMDEISAEHEELRRQGIPVDGILEVQKKKMEEQSYTQSQQQYQQYTTNINGTLQQHTNEMQSSLSNRVAKPFSAQEMTPAPYSNGDKQENQGEQIASRDERISTPAIKTGILLDTRRKTGGKPMFNFKDAPKVSPNPVLLNLLNRSEKKLGYESGTEEDYLSLGAEACNFLQSPRFKHKIPPPVAPKPMINPNTPPWAPQVSLNPWAPVPPQPQPQQPWAHSRDQVLSPSSSTENLLLHVWAENTGNSSPVNPMATILTTSAGPAYEMLTVKGKGADMFAKRQSRMEKYIVDSETVEANKASRSASPATSLPTEWKYSSNVRAPPPRAYNPIQSPLYPPAASKQPPNSSSSSKSKKKDKNKPPPKPLNVIDVMKHQPYQLNSSLFIFGPAEEAKPPTPQSPVSPYQQAPYPPAHSPPYIAPPSMQYQAPSTAPSTAPSYPIAARPESASAANPATAPKPKFTAKKSSAQVWKYKPYILIDASTLGRSYSLSPPSRVPSMGHQSLSPRPRKPLTPWEAASRHPLGSVDEAFAVQDLQQTLASSVHLAAQRKILPEPPADWQARVSYQAPKKSGSQTWSQGRGHTRAPLPSFVSPTKSGVSYVSNVTGYRSLPRQWQAQRSVTQSNFTVSFGVDSQNHRPPPAAHPGYQV